MDVLTALIICSKTYFTSVKNFDNDIDVCVCLSVLFMHKIIKKVLLFDWVSLVRQRRSIVSFFYTLIRFLNSDRSMSLWFVKDVLLFRSFYTLILFLIKTGQCYRSDRFTSYCSLTLVKSRKDKQD